MGCLLDCCEREPPSSSCEQESLVERELTEDELTQVADEVRSSWQSIGLHLGCTFQQLEDYKASHPDSMKDCLLHILCDWKAKEGRNATVAALVDACINAKVGGAVKKVLGIE